MATEEFYNTQPAIAAQVQSLISAGLRQVQAQNPSVPADKIGYRPLRFSDFVKLENVTPAASSLSYSWTIGAGSQTILTFTVPTAYVIGITGWWGSGISALGLGAYLQIQINNNTKVEVPLTKLANAPGGVLYTFDQVVFSQISLPMAWIVNNTTTSAATVFLWPVAYIFGPKANLNIN